MYASKRKPIFASSHVTKFPSVNFEGKTSFIVSKCIDGTIMKFLDKELRI